MAARRLLIGETPAVTGQELEFRNVNLDFDLGTIPGLSLRVGEYAGGNNINVNGDSLYFDDLVDLDGVTIGGVFASVTNGSHNVPGELVLVGRINSFTIGGSELVIDDVCVISSVPRKEGGVAVIQHSEAAPVPPEGGDLTTIRATVEAIRALPELRPVEDVESVPTPPFSDTNMDSGLQLPTPEGASAYAGLRETETIMVNAERERLSRDTQKRWPEHSTAPRDPEKWLKLAFAAGTAQIEPGLDPRIVAAVEQSRNREFTYGFLILNTYLDDRIERELEELGVELLGSHGTAQKVKVQATLEVLHEVVELPYVEWLGHASPGQKLDAQLKEALERHGQRLEEIPVVISLFENEARALFERSELGEEIFVGSYDAGLAAYTAVVPYSLVRELEEADYVLFIELDRPGGGGHDQSAAGMGVDYIRLGGSGANFSGSSTVVGILDTGFMLGNAAATMHSDLNKYGCGRNFTTDTAGVWDDEHGHGTHVLGTVGGTGTGDIRYRGMATGVGSSASTRIRVGKIWNSNSSSPSSAWMRNGIDYLAALSACGSDRPKVVNVSGGATGAAMVGTDARSRKLDERVWNQRQIYIVCSGNSGPGARTI